MVKLAIEGPVGHLEAWLAVPGALPLDRAGLLVVPGFPSDPGGGANSFTTFPDLADRIAEEAELVVLTFAFRGLAGSAGDFSLGGWRDDIRTAISDLKTRPEVERVWLIGFGTGGALAIDAAAEDASIAGVVSVAAPADFQDWASRPKQLLAHARRCGAIKDPDFPPDETAWSRELETVSAARQAERLAEHRPLLVLHGSNDDAVPVLDARAIAEAHRRSELKIIDGGRHHLRHDPRAMALAVGWLHRRGEQAVAADSA